MIHPLRLLTILILLIAQPVLAAPTAGQRVQPGEGFPDSRFPTRLIVQASSLGWYGYAGQPGEAWIQQRVESGAGEPVRLVRTSQGRQIYAFDRRLSPAETAAVIQKLQAAPGILAVEEDRLLYPDQIPDDPNFLNQYDLGAGPSGIGMAAAWDLTTGDPALRIAVIDTGITDHPDLAGRWTGGYDFIADPLIGGDGDGRDADPHDPGDNTPVDYCGSGFPPTQNTWHGTHVAGTLGAAANNAAGIAGINWRSPIVPIRVLGKCGGYLTDIADGIRWAAGLPVSGAPANPDPARVLNLSLGGTGVCAGFLQAAIDAANQAGAVVVVAAGNGNQSAGNTQPANCQGVITVGATRSTAADRAYYSNYGPQVTLSAPGDTILSTINTGATTLAGYGYALKSGTSMATPHVAGVVSLLLSLRPDLDYAAVREILTATTRPFAVGTTCASQPNLCGAGVLAAGPALRAVVPPDAPLPQPVMNSLTPALIYAKMDSQVNLHGSAFTPGLQAEIAGTRLPTVYESPSSLTVTIPRRTLPGGILPISLCPAETGQPCAATALQIQVDDRELAQYFLPAVRQ